MTIDQKPSHKIVNRFAVPSIGTMADKTTKRFAFDVENVAEAPLVSLPSGSGRTTLLRAKVSFNVFRQDYANNDQKLALFDELTHGLDLTIQEVTHGVYSSLGHPLQMKLKDGSDTRMPAYICDPANGSCYPSNGTCVDATDCRPGYSCGFLHLCTGCTVDGDCRANQRCLLATCIPIPAGG